MPGEELKRTPLYEEHVALGARMVPFAGWEMPVQYAGIIEEHNAVRSRGRHLRRLPHGRVPRLRRRRGRRRCSACSPTTSTRIADVGAGAVHADVRRRRRHHRRPDRLPHGRPRVPDHRQRVEPRRRTGRWLDAHLPDAVELVDESDRTGAHRAAGARRRSRSSRSSPARTASCPERFHVGGGRPRRRARAPRAHRLHGRGRRRDRLPREPRRADLARCCCRFPEVTPVRARRARHAAARDGLPPLRQRHGPHASTRSRRASAGSCRWTRATSSGARPIAAVQERGPGAQARRPDASPDGIPRHGYPRVARAARRSVRWQAAPSRRRSVTASPPRTCPAALVGRGDRLEVEIRTQGGPGRRDEAAVRAATRRCR